MKEKHFVSLIIIMMSLALLCSYHIYYCFLDDEENNLVESYYENKSQQENSIVKKVSYKEKDEYLGILNIPRINLKQGFYYIGSKNNNVNRSVTILKESIMPNENGSIVYLVAHSGSGYLAFFKDLNKLEINDIIYLDINNVSYKYSINDIYELDKNGKIMVNHNIHENLLVLSTCSDNLNKQLVITSKLIKNID